ncbi:MAG: hypothetical protein JXB32_19170 [Deltaproteobacteria bacterium]|nr:hypothetical protein [Deltaproteobacteria bacterium]
MSGLALLVLLAGFGCSTQATDDCPAGERWCPDGCTNVQTDRSNCGGCGNVCPAGQLCQAGVCACPSGQQLCAGECFNTQTNPLHCGTCGNACDPGQTCTNGVCSGNCPTGQTSCGGVCTNLQNDPDNCGDCGNACGAGEPCFDGACQSGCPVGFTECSGRCVDLQKDEENCGECAHACGAGELCDGGVCGIRCPDGYTGCSGVCVSLASDFNNCGECGHACDPGQVCSGGTCSGGGCPSGLMDCSGSCVDTDNDPRNCGECGHGCPAGQACTAGVCGVLCPTGQVNCSGLCVTLATDPDHCGECGHACRDDQVCESGICDCTGRETDCSGVCVNTDIDPDNCGTCGHTCTGSEACVDGACTVSCPSGTTACGGYCVDTDSDRNHCGSCDHACASTESCLDGVCSSGGGVPGDSCAAPIDVTGGGLFTGTITGASADYSGSCGGTSGRDVVFRYTLTATTDVSINTFGSGFDTLIYVRGSCGGGTDIGCNDDARSTLRSELVLLDQPAGTYYIILDTFSSYVSGSDYALHVYFSAPSSLGGDACGEPSWIDIGTAADVSGNTCPWYWINARDDSVACSRGSGGLDFVYYFVVTTRGEYTFDTCGGDTDWDSILDLRRVCNDPSSTARVACNDDSCSLQSSVTATLDPGVYYLWIDGYSSSACGGYQINITH